MTDKQRAGIKSALDAATSWNAEQADTMNAEALAFFEAEGKIINRLSAEQQASWKRAMAPVWDEYGTDVIGENAMQRLIAIAKD